MSFLADLKIHSYRGESSTADNRVARPASR